MGRTAGQRRARYARGKPPERAYILLIGLGSWGSRTRRRARRPSLGAPLLSRAPYHRSASVTRLSSDVGGTVTAFPPSAAPGAPAAPGDGMAATALSSLALAATPAIGPARCGTPAAPTMSTTSHSVGARGSGTSANIISGPLTYLESVYSAARRDRTSTSLCQPC